MAITPSPFSELGKKRQPVPQAPVVSLPDARPVAQLPAMTSVEQTGLLPGTTSQNPFAGSPVGAGARREAPAVGDVQESDVQAALDKYLSRLTGAPGVSAKDYQEAKQRSEELASWQSRAGGGRQDTLIGLLPERAERAVRKAGATFTEGFIRALATPGRAVQSLLDELVAEPLAGDLPQFDDLITQTFDFENFNPEYRPIQDIGNLFDKDWGEGGFTHGVDTLLNVSAQIAGDPLTYTTLSPLKYQGTAGRAAAAQDFLKSGYASRLDDAAKARYAADIQRYGEYALPTQVRTALVNEGVFGRTGVRFAGQVIPGTGAGAEAAGLRIGRTRAAIGDAMPNIATAMMPGSTTMLAGVARGKGKLGFAPATEEILTAFGAHASAVNAKANAGSFGVRLAGEHGPYVRTVSDLDDVQNRAVINHLEGVEELSDPNLLELAEGYTTRTRMVLDESNALQREVSEAHGLRLEEVPVRDNYFHRTFSQSWRRFASSSRRQTKAAVERIGKELGVDVRSLRKKAGFTMQRREMDTFLGVPLVHKGRSTVELNDITEAQYGVRMFEENVGKNLQSYMKDAVDKFQRESFINHLFRVAPGRIKPLLSTAPKSRQLAKIIDQMEKDLKKIVQTISGGQASTRVEGEQFLKDVLATATEITSPGFRNARKARQAERMLRERVTALRQQVEDLRTTADMSQTQLFEEMETVLRPLQARLDTLQAAVDAGDGGLAAAYEWLMNKHIQLFPDVASRPTSVNELARDVIRYAEDNLSGAARASALRAAETRRAGAIRRGATVEVEGVQRPLSEVRAEAKGATSEVAKAEREFNRVIAKDPSLRVLGVAERKLNREAAKMDAKAALSGAWDRWVAEIGNPYLLDISQVRRLLDELPPASAGYEATAAWLRKVEDTMSSMLRAGYTDEEVDTLSRIMAQLFAGEADLATQQLSIAQARKLEQSVRQGLVDGDWTKDLEKGWIGIDSLNAQVSREMADVLEGTDYAGLVGDFLAKIKDPSVRTYMGEMYDQLLAYFKNTAVLTLGFTVRNVVTGLFNNVVYDTTPAQFKDGIIFAKNVTRFGLNRALDMVPEGERARYALAFDIVAATGGGRNVDEIIPIVGRDRRRFENRAAQAAYNTADYVFRPFGGRVGAGARRGNEAAELGIRLPLALNAVDQGFGLEAGAARIARVQFDYTDLSALDRSVKRFIPFWVFASRNIPLQMVNQALRPGAYRAYDKLREAGGEYDPRLQRWRALNGPIRIGDYYLDLDLPFQSVGDDLSGMLSLSGLLGQAAPMIRTPIEYVTNQRIAFGTSYPYSERYRKAGVLDLPGALLGLVSGDADALTQGLIKESRQDVAIGALPAFANAQRYVAAILQAVGSEDAARRIAGGPERYYKEDADRYAIMKALGVDLYKLTEEGKSDERARIIRELTDLQREESRMKAALEE